MCAREEGAGQKSGPSMVVSQTGPAAVPSWVGLSVFSQPPQLEQQPARLPPSFQSPVGPIGKHDGVYSRSCRLPEVLRFFFVSILYKSLIWK